MLPPANLKPHPALANTPQVAAADLKQLYNPNAIINVLDTYIFSKDLIRKNTAEYRRLRALRHFINEYITVARKGKLPGKRNTKPPPTPHRTGEPPSPPTGRSGREYQYEAAYMAMLLMMKPHRLIRAAYIRFFQGRKTACPATMADSS